MKIKEQTRKLTAGCSKHCFEVADKTDEVRNHTYVKATLTRFEEIFEEYYLGEVMRFIYLIIGFLSLALAIVGVVLPLLPTTPFLLLSIACFSRSSKRFEDWLYHTKLYQAYVADFRETKSIAPERKKKIIVSIYILMGISIYFAPLLPVKIGLGALTIFITYYLFKVIPDKE